MKQPVAQSQPPAAEGAIGRAFPSRNDGVTMAGAVCPVCGAPFRPVGRRRFCSDACRQAAWRGRHPGSGLSGGGALAPPQAGSPAPASRQAQGAPSATVYECPSCGVRYLDEQRCPDCHLFCRRVGPGGRCPHCEEPVALGDLIAEGE
jgi:hypothetical protein